jgi:hypothetical protein
VTAGRRRRRLDFYPTPSWASDVLWDAVRPFSWAEPCVGRGDLITDRNRSELEWTNDVDPAREADHHLNACYPSAWDSFRRVPWIVTNPPFRVADQVLKLALAHATVGVAFLLRLSFLEPTDSRVFTLTRRPPDRLIVLPRISFTGDGKTDSVTCAWMLWDIDGNADLDRGITVVGKQARP